MLLIVKHKIQALQWTVLNGPRIAVILGENTAILVKFCKQSTAPEMLIISALNSAFQKIKILLRMLYLNDVFMIVVL
jgi:hypothetical protein